MQNKLIYICIYIIFLFTNSCHKSEIYYNNLSDDYLKSLFTCNGYYVEVTVPLKNDKILVIPCPTLLYIYQEYYQNKYNTEFDFLRALYNGKIQDIEQYFKNYTKVDIDKSILKEYKKHGLNYIIEKYLKSTKDKYYTFKGYEINYTLVKIMFINNYYLYYYDNDPTFLFKLHLDNLAIPEEWQ